MSHLSIGITTLKMVKKIVNPNWVLSASTGEPIVTELDWLRFRVQLTPNLTNIYQVVERRRMIGGFTGNIVSIEAKMFVYESK